MKRLQLNMRYAGLCAFGLMFITLKCVASPNHCMQSANWSQSAYSSNNPSNNGVWACTDPDNSQTYGCQGTGGGGDGCGFDLIGLVDSSGNLSSYLLAYTAPGGQATSMSPTVSATSCAQYFQENVAALTAPCYRNANNNWQYSQTQTPGGGMSFNGQWNCSDSVYGNVTCASAGYSSISVSCTNGGGGTASGNFTNLAACHKAMANLCTSNPCPTCYTTLPSC